MKRNIAQILCYCLSIILFAVTGTAENLETTKIIWNANGIRTKIYFAEAEFFDDLPDYAYLFKGNAVQLVDENPDSGLACILAFGLKCYVPSDALIDEIPEEQNPFTLERTTLYQTNLLWIQDGSESYSNGVTEQVLHAIPQGSNVQVIGFIQPYVIIRFDQTEGVLFYYDFNQGYPLHNGGVFDYAMDYPGIFPVEMADQLAREALQQEYGLAVEEIANMKMDVKRSSNVTTSFQYTYHFFPDEANPNTLYQVIISAETGMVLSIYYVEADASQFLG